MLHWNATGIAALCALCQGCVVLNSRSLPAHQHWHLQYCQWYSAQHARLVSISLGKAALRASRVRRGSSATHRHRRPRTNHWRAAHVRLGRIRNTMACYRALHAALASIGTCNLPLRLKHRRVHRVPKACISHRKGKCNACRAWLASTGRAC